MGGPPGALLLLLLLLAARAGGGEGGLGLQGLEVDVVVVVALLAVQSQRVELALRLGAGLFSEEELSLLGRGGRAS